jgi:hypothetical protein
MLLHPKPNILSYNIITNFCPYGKRAILQNFLALFMQDAQAKCGMQKSKKLPADL